jgi:predicted HAD superfamily phosphohydrolase YqeG
MGFLSILVNPVSNIDGLGARFNRIFERMIFKSLDKRGLFKIGEYYE